MMLGMEPLLSDADVARLLKTTAAKVRRLGIESVEIDGIGRRYTRAALDQFITTRSKGVSMLFNVEHADRETLKTHLARLDEYRAELAEAREAAAKLAVEADEGRVLPRALALANERFIALQKLCSDVDGRARRRLFDECPNDYLKTQFNDLLERMAIINHERGAARREVERHEQEVAKYQRRLDEGDNADDVKAYLSEQVALHQRSLDRHNERLLEKEQELHAINEEREALRAKMVEA